jgi:nicotinate phosphoribosyltransferase
VYLGVLARRTRVASNTRRVVEAAWPKPVMFFPARFDHWLVQTGDGYAAHVAGAIGVSTDAQASWWGAEGLGTVPHALIAAFGGDTVAATRALAVARALGSRLHGVRLDTSEAMVDASLVPRMGDFDPRGVNPQLVRLVRAALDAEHYQHVQITVSGGFDAEKIARFEREQVPVDAYGVGSSLFGGRFDFTADIVMVDGRSVAKQGRGYRDNPRLERVD